MKIEKEKKARNQAHVHRHKQEREKEERETHRRVGGLDSGFGGDDGVGGGENRLGGGVVVVVVAASHGGIRMREREHFRVTGDRESTVAERFRSGEMHSWIWKTEN